ncbi:MAG: hypothetical protein JJU11_07645 [Candidatus Sumerlaeia bacterium]|nr:hypothetical protein [Candidatus Sumerlaeia bacterium]
MTGSLLKMITLLVAVTLSGVGCAKKSWSYDTSGQRVQTERQSLLIAVITPFDDGRPSIAQETNSLLWLVPLVPWSTATLHRAEQKGSATGVRADADSIPPPSEYEKALKVSIETISSPTERERAQRELDALRAQREGGPRLRSEYSLPHIIPASIADEIQASRLTDEVILIGSLNEGLSNTAARPDFYISGRLELVQENRETLSYGLSIAAPVLWLFLPARNVNYRLAYTVELKDRDGKTISTHTYRTARDRSSHWIYGGAAFGHVYNRHLPTLAQTINHRVVRDISTLLDTFPQDYFNFLKDERASRGATR